MRTKRKWGFVLLLVVLFLLTSTAIVSAQGFDVYLPSLIGAPQHVQLTVQAASLTEKE